MGAATRRIREATGDAGRERTRRTIEAMKQSGRYRAKAQEIRDRGARMSDTRLRDEMLIIASQYEQLAQEAERFEPLG